MKRTNELIVGLAMVAVIAAVTWALFAVGDNMTPGVTPFSQDVYQLHMVILGIVTVIGVLVFAAMFTSIYLHRKSKGAEAAQFTHSTKAEITWTVIPILILVVMAIQYNGWKMNTAMGCAARARDATRARVATPRPLPPSAGI